MRTFLPILFLSAFLLEACDSGTKIDSQKVAEEMRGRKIVRATPAQLTEAAFREGQSLADWLDQRLVQVLENDPDRTEIVKWAARCNPKHLAADSLETARQVRIQRLPLRGAAKPFDEKTAQVWDAYRYNAENNLPLEPNVQRDGEDLLLYSRPIGLHSATCLRCHGTVGKDLKKEEFAALRAAYPAMDSLSGYTSGQPIGIWNLLYQKSGLAARVKAK